MVAAAPLVTGSRFYQRLQRRYGDDFTLLPPGVPGAAVLAQAMQKLLARGPGGAAGLGVALRTLRQLALARLIEYECAPERLVIDEALAHL